MNNVYTQEDSMSTPNQAYPSSASRRTVYKSSHWQETMLQDKEPAQDCTQHESHIHHASPIRGLPPEQSPLANQNSTQVCIEHITFAGLDTHITMISEKTQLTSPTLPKDGGTTNHGAKLAQPKQKNSSSEVMQWYDLRICLQHETMSARSEWKALSEPLTKLSEIDPTIMIYLWKNQDLNWQLPIYIWDESIPFFNLPTYVPCLATYKWFTSNMRHPYMLLGSSAPPHKLVQELCPWLWETKQGFWPWQLPLVEQTTCLGWLCFSAPEYNLADLHQSILQWTGVHVVLCFQSITNHLQGQTAWLAPQTKVTHIEVDHAKLQHNHQLIQSIFSSKTQQFTLGIQMRLVLELESITNPKTREKVVNLQDIQAWFPAKLATCLLWGHQERGYNKAQTYNTLWQFLLTNPQPTKSSQLALCSKSYGKNDGFIIWYLLQHQPMAMAVLDWLQATVSGVQVGYTSDLLHRDSTLYINWQGPSGYYDSS